MKYYRRHKKISLQTKKYYNLLLEKAYSKGNYHHFIWNPNKNILKISKDVNKTMLK